MPNDKPEMPHTQTGRPVEPPRREEPEEEEITPREAGDAGSDSGVPMPMWGEDPGV